MSNNELIGQGNNCTSARTLKFHAHNTYSMDPWTNQDINMSLGLAQIQQEYNAGLAGALLKSHHVNSTNVDEQWYCNVTPNDGYVDGSTRTPAHYK